ncbi:hypothetical protein LEP1GSC111_1320 [Leptospira interrogans str. UT126]|nr:hypothetical protein LEP1GSC111_1571 [Leptospira interrogans str. UT126]EMJ48648.1 hypothetical protein LEP1GSC111_2981 [Leptospira interrogans str. UT126]EMJ51222.1 hypothetical protein LEP1GSC111_1417 [Leptospira interrogans str. UT126]EMJ51633.1 hypothetical protein LEP1GSC111_3284 [Leptospira interrogans str. UT126]EMJ51926.1 hypothetical protein LEP1GSC111_4130 [Leptospira interrogans str. UT126]
MTFSLPERAFKTVILTTLSHFSWRKFVSQEQLTIFMTV